MLKLKIKPKYYNHILIVQIDITWFPFDDQECELKFGSWTYQAGALNLSLTTEKGDISDFKKNGVSILTLKCANKVCMNLASKR